MPGGRPPIGVALVDRLEGPEEQKRLLKTILAVIREEKSVEVASTELGIGRARYYQLQEQALGAALVGLAPKPPGRPPTPPPSAAEIESQRLRDELAEAKLLKHAAEIKAELAQVLPGVLARGQKKRRKPW